jgi:hypothetical protein
MWFFERAEPRGLVLEPAGDRRWPNANTTAAPNTDRNCSAGGM